MKRVLTSIWVLALIIAVPVIVSFPPVFDKYMADLLSKEFTDANITNIYFEDLDGDGIREKITSHQNSANELAIQLHSNDGGVKSQQNFNYNYFKRANNVYFGDVDNDKQLEIYGFTLKEDSLFLNWFEPTTFYRSQKSKFITRISTFDDGKIDFAILHFEVVDLENDSKNEILISIEAGYSIHPRVVIIYKRDEDRIIRSDDRGINSYTPFLHDLNNDGIFEIITSSVASDNLFSATGISGVDDRPWLQVFNSELKHFFEPVPFSEGLSNTTQTFVTKDGKNDLLVFNCNRSREREKIIQFVKFDNKGNRIASRYLSEYGKDFTFKIFQTDSEFLIYTGNEVLWVNNDLKVIKHKEIAPSLSIIATDTLSKLNQSFFIARTHLQNELVIYTEEFDEDVHLLFEGESIKSVLTRTEIEFNSFFVRTDKQEYHFSFKRNKLYFLKYPLFFLIYFSSVVFIWFIQKIIESRLKEKYELQSQVRELQLKTLRNQLDPHFIFNTLNGVASVIKKGDNEKAYEVFMRFSKMVRHILENVDNDFISLKLEMELVYNFIELQKFRYKELFSYEIQIENEKLDDFLIPRMIIQIHVENAIRHGLIPKGGNGFLKIAISTKNENLFIVIEDNGIGREKASQIDNGKHGIGLKSVDGIIANINFGGREKITQKIIDLKDDENQSCGIRIEIVVFKW